jgi:hypothetical protein
MTHLREGARREHRAISLLCVIQCWCHGWDGIRITREQLERLLGLSYFRQTRVEWMEEDFSEMFQHQRPTSGQWTVYPFPGLELSRRAFEERPLIGEFEMWEHLGQNHAVDLSDELLLTSYLSLLAQGRISPRSVPPASKEQPALVPEQLPAEPFAL